MKADFASNQAVVEGFYAALSEEALQLAGFSAAALARIVRS